MNEQGLHGRLNRALCTRCLVRRATYWQLVSIFLWVSVAEAVAVTGFTRAWFWRLERGILFAAVWSWALSFRAMDSLCRDFRWLVDRVLLTLFGCPCGEGAPLVIPVPVKRAAAAA